MRACWLKWVGRDWSISADYIWLNYSDANNGVFPAVLLLESCSFDVEKCGCFRGPNKVVHFAEKYSPSI